MWSNRLWQLFGIEKKPGRYPTYDLWKSAIHPDERDTVIEAVNRAVALEAELNIQYRVLRPDGTCRWVLETGKPVYGKNGKLKRYCGLSIDITDQKKFDDEIHIIRDNLDLLLEKLNVGWFHMNLDDNTATRTIEHARIFGYDTFDADWSLDRFLGHVVDEDKPKIRNILQEMVSTHNDTICECQIYTTNGEKRRIWSSNSLLFDERGKPTHLVGIVQDITDGRSDQNLSGQ